jgi:hypothetical protein
MEVGTGPKQGFDEHGTARQKMLTVVDDQERPL